MRTSALLTALATYALLSGCGTQPRPVGLKEISELREYTWEATVPHPQAQWNPVSYQVVSRSIRGVALFAEGIGKQTFLASQEGRESCHPCWINQQQFVFGPSTLMIIAPDGRPVSNNQGLTVVTLGAAGDSRTITNRGYRPRIWNEFIVAQDEERIITIDQDGVIEDFAPGFFAEPQRTGPGICWLDRPVTESDLWSGNSYQRGKLIIRWKRDVVTEIADAIEPRWTSSGGVVATRLLGEPKKGEAWWKAGTELVYIAGPKAKPVVIASNARTAAPHPLQPILAAVDSTNGALLLCDLLGSEPRRYADHGDHPQWSADGMRLMAEEPVPGKDGMCSLHVYVLKVGNL